MPRTDVEPTTYKVVQAARQILLPRDRHGRSWTKLRGRRGGAAGPVLDAVRLYSYLNRESTTPLHKQNFRACSVPRVRIRAHCTPSARLRARPEDTCLLAACVLARHCTPVDRRQRRRRTCRSRHSVSLAHEHVLYMVKITVKQRAR